MKKLILSLLAISFLIACEKESISELSMDEATYEEGALTARNSNVISICHKGKVKSLNVDAIADHRAHGDAVDMDGDGYFDMDNPCGDTDCDDMVYDVENSCGCVEGELEVQIDPDGTPGNGDEYTLYVYPTDNGNGIRWANTFTDIGATDIWDGYANTDAIVADQGAGTNYAAGLCASLKTDGCDWYLPARNEINAMYEQLGPAPNNNFASEYPYWSSTENFYNSAIYQNFRPDGGQSYLSKTTILFHCRCVRR